VHTFDGLMEVSSRIPEKLFFRIGEVCELIKVQPHVLRYWETEFPMLTPQKNRAGQRVYRRRDVEIVMRIRNLLYEEKFTIAGAKKKLQDEMRGPAKSRPHEPAAIDEPPDLPDDEEVIAAPATHAAPAGPAAPSAPAPNGEQTTPSQAHLALRLIRDDLEDLLTMLKSDASIKSSAPAARVDKAD
jgi:DNA-binding transcriptional MerR regulator